MSKNKNDILTFINSVIDKKFNVVSKGYDPKEVDKILDEIFYQFEKYFNQTNVLETKYNDLVNEVEELKKQKSLLIDENDDLKYRMKRLEDSGIYSEILMKIVHQNNEQEEKKTKTRKQDIEK